MKKILLLGASALCLNLVPVGALAQAASQAGVESSSGLESVVVTAQRDFRAGALKSDIIKTEVIDAKQIDRVNAGNINQAIDFNPGISVQTECSVCNVRTIALNNLPGRFTTLMIDGVPLFSSLSGAYGLDSVSVRGTQNIEIARGAGASLIAPEALAGVVNIVTKRPEKRELDASAEIDINGSQRVDAYLGDVLDDQWSGALTATLAKRDQIDSDGNGVSEFTGFTRAMAGVALFGDLPHQIKAKIRADFVYEDRNGGALGTDLRAIEASTTGNPFDWSAGAHASPRPDGWYAPDGSGFVPWTTGRGGLAEIVSTRRASLISTFDGRLSPDLQWRVAFGYARNSQHSFYEQSRYYANGNQIYSELSAKYLMGESILTAGFNYRYEDLASRGQTNTGVPVIGIDDYAYRVPGVFLQYYRAFFDDTVEANASIRYDHHNVFGAIVSPRFNVLWHHTDKLSSFFSIGRGYRAPTSFFEQDHGVLDTVRIVRQIKDPEVSDNASYALNYADDRLALTVSYNYNQIRHFAILDPNQIDAAGNRITLFTDVSAPVTVQGVDFTGSYQLLPGLGVSLGGEAFKYDFQPGTLIFSRPDWKLYASADWDSGPWELFGRVTVTGPQNLAKFYDYANNQQYNLDGTPMMRESPVFARVDIKASYALDENWSLYAGIDNLFDYQQTKVEGPIFLHADGSYDVTHIWGPLQPRYIYAGVKLSL